MKKIKIFASGVISLSLPMVAMAATLTSGLETVKTILNMVIGLLFILVTLWFIWGIIQYVMAAGDEGKIKDGKQHMIWGIIGMAVMAGAWGLARVLLDTFGVSSTSIPTNVGF